MKEGKSLPSLKRQEGGNSGEKRTLKTVKKPKTAEKADRKIQEQVGGKGKKSRMRNRVLSRRWKRHVIPAW